MKTAILALVIALSFGCGSSGNPTRYYVLNPVLSGETLVGETPPTPALSVEIASLRLPQYLERPHVVTRHSGSRLDVAEFHQWGGSLRKDLTRVMAKNLSRLLATPLVFISPHAAHPPPDFRLEVEVIKFERDPDGKVRLSARWSLTGGRDRALLTAQIAELESPAVAPSPDLEPTVTAMGLIWGELSRTIAQWVWNHASVRPGA